MLGGIILFIIVVFGGLLFIFSPKKGYEFNLLHFCINRNTIALVFVGVYVVGAVIYWNLIPHNLSAFYHVFLEILYGIPFGVILAMGYGGSEFLMYLGGLAYLGFLTVCIKLFIPRTWVSKLRSNWSK